MPENHNHVTVNVGKKDDLDAKGCGIALLAVLLISGLFLLFVHPAVGIVMLVVVGVSVYLMVRGQRKHERRVAELRALTARKDARRAELEGLATVGPTGVCGFCGALEQHRDGYGVPFYPRAWHQGDIDRPVAELT